ncbi:sensor histidine kinase [Pedobacter sp. SL55]|uniref:sensor histidine kinase n=1 Tax=Pedobacter sp. SL55 TaxID=2995161 RepID=UPI0022700750|nr:ATP-binding protein [Pedobacter sp. SL55]WAC40074.1 ATP-binding protein [Pedobacter sp. SL55]
MRLLIDRDSLQQNKSIIAFKELLEKEKQNITEPGEKEAVLQLFNPLELFLATRNSAQLAHIIKLNVIQSDALEILDYALNAVKLQAQQKEITFNIDVPQQLPMLWADQEKTAWVLINFLNNAIRYSGAHSKIDIGVILNEQWITFKVKDYGKGIAEQYKNDLFKRYFQVPTDGQHKSGSGLSLSISKDFIEAQQGKIWVESELGEGNCFSFSLPIAK